MILPGLLEETKVFNHSEFGLWGEAESAKFLKKKGYKILTRNFETSFGEIDIVAFQTARAAKRQAKALEKAGKSAAQKFFEAKGNTLVFVEVKTRTKRSAERVLPQEAVGKTKQEKYQMLAEVFVSKTPKFADVPIRFDIVEVVGDKQNFEINHIENAF